MSTVLDARFAPVADGAGPLAVLAVLASALGQAGATLVLNGRDADKLQASADVLRGEGLVAQTSGFDVTDAPAVRGAVAAIEAEQGPIDILVNNAGMQIRNPLHESTTTIGGARCGPTPTASSLSAKPLRKA